MPKASIAVTLPLHHSLRGCIRGERVRSVFGAKGLQVTHVGEGCGMCTCIGVGGIQALDRNDLANVFYSLFILWRHFLREVSKLQLMVVFRI